MPVALTPEILGPFILYRDSALRQPLSSLRWSEPLNLARLDRPGNRRVNLLPNGNFVLSDESKIDHPNTLSEFETDGWSSHGPTSLRLTPLPITSVYPIVSSSDDFIMSAIPGRRYSCGISVYVDAVDSKTLALTMNLGPDSYTSTVTVEPLTGTRIEILDKKCPYINDLLVLPGVGSTTITRATFDLEALSLFDDTESLLLDGIFIGEGPSGEFVPRQAYPSYSLPTPPHTKLWCFNNSDDTYENVRVYAVPATPSSSRTWIEASAAPDIESWTTAYNRPVLVQESIAPQDNFSFWVRPMTDEHAVAETHHLTLRVIGDAV